jgi:thiamine-phosphate pyrophosphorylase
VTWAIPRLYAILDVDAVRACGRPPLDVLDAWLGAGVRLVQLRAKTLSFGPFLALADDVVRRAAPLGAAVNVNDRVDVAMAADAAGVHVGQADLTPAEVRSIAGAALLVGLSTHNEEQVRAATRAPVDYVAVGPVYETRTKERPDPVVGLEGVRMAAEAVGPSGRPIVAIGGIRLEHARDVLAAGASSIAVISDLLQGDPGARAREWIETLG